MGATRIPKRLIADNSIDNSKIAAGAAIALSKLADGLKLVLNDGSVIMVGALNMGNFNFTNLAAASGAGQAVEYSQFNSAISALNTMYQPKNAVRVAMPTNVTLTAPGATMEGQTMVLNDRFLAYSQTTPSQNGIYLWKGASATAVRATDFDEWTEIPGTTIPVLQGTTNADVIFLSTADPGGTLGTTSITFIKVGVAAGLQYTNFILGETPAGAVNGTNTIFTLANTPQTGKESVYASGVKLLRGAGNDYTITGAVITMLEAPVTGENITADYLI